MKKFLFLAIIYFLAGGCKSIETSPLASEDLDISTQTSEKTTISTHTMDTIPIDFEKSLQTFASIPTWKIGLADLDGDNDLDAVFANSLSNFSQVWINNGNGIFTDSGQQLGRYGHGVDIGDLDGDGDLDILITTHKLEPTRVYLNDGKANFLELEEAFDRTTGHSVDLFDLDEDGDLDAVGEGSGKVSLFWNDGQGRFTASDINFPMTTAWGDLDSDGDVDLLIKEDKAGYSVHLNDGKGNFILYWNLNDTEAMNIGDMVLGDVDNDGDLDAVVTNGFHQTTSYPGMIFLNDGTGRLEDSKQRFFAAASAGVSLGDLDNDNDLDMVFTDHMEPCQIWLNDGNGVFIDSGFRFGGDQFYRHAHLGDLDGDGDLDIFLATFGLDQGPNEIWFNQFIDGSAAESGDDLLPTLQPISRENAENLQLVLTMEIPGYITGWISQCSVAFSPDSTLLVGTCGISRVPVWEVQSGKLLHTLYGAPEQIVTCTFSPSGNIIACNGFDETITLWDAASGEIINRFEKIGAPIWDLAFNPIGTSFVSCSLGRSKSGPIRGSLNNWDFLEGNLK